MDPAAAAAALSEQEIGHFDALDLSISTAAQRRFLGVVGAGRAHVGAVIEFCSLYFLISSSLFFGFTLFLIS